MSERASSNEHARRPVAMVTGGAKRIGRAIAIEFASRGFDLVVTYRSSEGEAESLAAFVAESFAPATVELHRLDLGDLKAVLAFAQGYAASGAGLDVLVHNASLYFPTALDELDAERAELLHRVNAIAPLLLTAGLAPVLSGGTLPGGGCVVAMSDIHALGRPRKDFSAYSMSKAALSEMVRSLARDLSPRVRVVGVAPGVVQWPEDGYEADAEAQEAYLRRVPLGRAGTPEDAAKTVGWLATEATYITGQIIKLDGGRSIA